jgi:catechol 2,3-dioxygenase
MQTGTASPLAASRAAPIARWASAAETGRAGSRPPESAAPVGWVIESSSPRPADGGRSYPAEQKTGSPFLPLGCPMNESVRVRASFRTKGSGQMGVMRMGYVHVRVTDLEESRSHYGETLGMKLVQEEPGKLYYKGWDEFDHHSVVLEEGGVGVVKFGYKVERETDLEELEQRARQFGCLTERMSKGDNVAIGDGVRIVLPSDHVIELYAEAEHVGTDVGLINPDAFPRHLVGVGVPRVDHAMITTEDPTTLERFYQEVMAFHPAERVVDNLDDNHLIASWLSCGNTAHDIAFIAGPQGKLHHFAYNLTDWYAIKHAGGLFAMDDVSVDVGPTQHGITRGETIYFFDPSGNRNEVFNGGYLVFRDSPPLTWTVDQLGKAIFYIQRELNERFTTVLT